MRSVLAVGLWPYIGMGAHAVVNERLRTSPAAQGIFAGQSLLYDTVVIPTLDFGILPALITWLSLKALREGIDDGSIRLLRYPGMMGYAGNGAGLVVNLRFGKGKSSAWEWSQATSFGEMPEAVELQVKHGCDMVPEWERKTLSTAILNASSEFDTSDDFSRKIAKETNGDIAGDSQLRSAIGKFYGYRTIELNRLPGPAENQIRFFSGGQVALGGTQVDTPYLPPQDGIDLVLAVAQLNLQIAMAASLTSCDLSTFDGAARLLKAKVARSGFRQESGSQFSHLLEIPGVPNVPAALAEGRLGIEAVWQLRRSATARQFRQWLGEGGGRDGRELAKLYTQSLEKERWISSYPARTLRWAVIAAAGAIASRVAGIPGEIGVAALAGVDSLFVEKWLSGYSPRLFIDELKRLRIEPTLGSAAPN